MHSVDNGGSSREMQEINRKADQPQLIGQPQRRIMREIEESMIDFSVSFLAVGNLTASRTHVIFGSSIPASVI